MANKILHIFFEVDMRCSHDGLKELLVKKKVSLKTIKQGDCIVFINNAQNRVKLFASGAECLVYLNPGKRIDPETIPLIPHYLNGDTLDYSGALKEALMKRMVRKKKR